MLRVTGGEFRGTRLFCPPNIRPTSGKTKEYIFSQLVDIPPGYRVLDLFAGCGALGIEALSRGAKEAVFVDKSAKSIGAVRNNLEKLRIKAKVIRADAKIFIRKPVHELFDLILIDPPYDNYKPAEIIEATAKNFAADNALIVYEMSSSEPEPDVSGAQLLSLKKMGDTTIGIWKK